MIESIKHATDRKPKDIEELLTTDDPIVMYGAGSYATDVYKFLVKHGIKISDFCVDADFMRTGMLFMNKYPVISIEEVYKKHEKPNIVIGFSDYVKARNILEKLGNNAQIYFIDAPNQEHFFDYVYIKEHQSAFEYTYNMLEDQKSKDIMTAFINAKLSGDPKSLYPFAEFNQYFNNLIKLSDHETLVDCGAYDGDTIFKFLDSVNGCYKKIFAFEPDKLNQGKLLSRIKDTQLQNIEVVKKGTWSKPDNLKFSADGNMTTMMASGDIDVPVDTIDNVVGDEKVTLIKMDIEGAELESLKGAQKIIKRDRPKLAICIYHKPEDLITIPQYIKSLCSDYSLYIRHHQHMSWETVLYAILEAKESKQQI